jgi:flotillin
MNLEELQEQRATFVKAVQDAVGADIQNNGLELESVSLTRLDQSDIKHFNPSNFFDAHGLTTLTKITKEREQERNQIVRTTEVNIAQQDLVARQTTLTIESTKREAELAQQRDIANKTAAMRAQTAQVEQTALQNEAEYRIQQELAVANKQTEANQLRDTRKIEADLAVKRRNTEMDRDLQIVAQESAITVATKSKEQSEAQTIAETARALAIAAEEKVITARATEVAERDKIINVIAARKAAETNAMPITVMAEAERQAAANKAEATSVLAKADANAASTRAAGVKALGQAEAEVATMKAEARNKLSPTMIDYDLNLARINVIPSALAEAVKPIEKISDIRIFDTGSLLGRGGSANGGMNGHGLGLGDGLAAQLLSVSAFRPIIDKILTEAGFAAGPDALTSLTAALAAQQLASSTEPAATVADASAAPPASISGTGKATLGPKS